MLTWHKYNTNSNLYRQNHCDNYNQVQNRNILSECRILFCLFSRKLRIYDIINIMKYDS